MVRKEKMKSNGREKDNFFGENSLLTSNNNNNNNINNNNDNNYYDHHDDDNNQYNSSSVSSYSYENGYNLCDVGSSSMTHPPPFDPSQFSTQNNNFVDHHSYYVSPTVSDSSWFRGSNNGGGGRGRGGVGGGVSMDEIGLINEFRKLDIGRFGVDGGGGGGGSDGFGLDNSRIIRPSRTENFVGLEGFCNENVGGFSSPLCKDYSRVNNGLGDSVGSYSPYVGGAHQLDCLIHYNRGDFRGNVGGIPITRGNGKLCSDRMSLYNCDDYVDSNGWRVSRMNEGFGNGGDFGGQFPVQLTSMYGGAHVVDDPLQRYVMEGCKDALSSPNYGLSSLGLSGLGRENTVYNTMRGNMRGLDHMFGPTQSIALLKNMRRPSAGDENLNGRKKTLPNGSAIQKINERRFDLERSAGVSSPVGSCDSLVFQAMFSSLSDVRGEIYLMAKDQHGCRFLQKKFEDGSFEDVQAVFDGVINYVIELMIDPFGNYLIQKLLDVCNEEQKMKIVHAVTKDRGELVRICLNTHGTRVVQKLLDSLKTRKQVSLIIRALEPGFLDLVKDLNGNHVVQRCLQSLNYDENKFIFDAATKFCVEIATHRHGCCVLQRCIAHSNGDHRNKLVGEICNNGFILAQDPFGNYVVQYIIEQKIPAAAAQLISQFEGKYVHLSMQKFSSHVVEKCLKFIEESQARIVYELLSVPHFEQLLQDPFANYVIQSALEVTKGGLNESLVAAVRPHSTLRTNPYCKKIFTRGLVRK